MITTTGKCALCHEIKETRLYYVHPVTLIELCPECRDIMRLENAEVVTEDQVLSGDTERVK